MSIETEQKTPKVVTIPEQRASTFNKHRGPRLSDTYRGLAQIAFAAGDLDSRQEYLAMAEMFDVEPSK